MNTISIKPIAPIHFDLLKRTFPLLVRKIAEPYPNKNSHNLNGIIKNDVVGENFVMNKQKNKEPNKKLGRNNLFFRKNQAKHGMIM